MKMLRLVRGSAYVVALVSVAHVRPLVAQDRIPQLQGTPGQSAQSGQGVTGRDDGLRGPREPHPAADEAIARLKSPYCPGLMLEVCTSYTGALLRDSIQAMAREGWTTDELVDWVLANHGEEYLAYPAASGTGLLAWVVPPVAILLGILAVVVALRYMRRDAAPQETAGAELSPEEEARLRGAMKEMESAEEPVF